MLTVTFTESEKKLSLRLEGHAGYAEHGKDIVCASATILAYTLASIIDTFDDDVEAFVNLSSGDTTIGCKCKNDIIYSKIADAFRYTKMGYALLEHNYPQYVKLML